MRTVFAGASVKGDDSIVITGSGGLPARFIRTSGDRLELAYHEKNALRSKEGRDVEIKEYYSGETFRVELAQLTADQVDTILRMVFPN